MSEERPVPVPPMEASATKANGAVDDVDAIAIGEEPVATPPAVAAVVPRPGASKPPPAEGSPSSSRFKSEPAGAKRTGRPRMTLKIPDDEVARPQTTPSTPPAKITSGDASPDASAVAITATRIITIEPPPSTDLPPMRAFAPTPTSHPISSSPPALTSTREDSWTPYQPTVADQMLPPPGKLIGAPRTASSPSTHSSAATPSGVAAAAVAATPSGVGAVATPSGAEARAPSGAIPEPRRFDSIDDIPIVTEPEPEPEAPPPESVEPLELEDADGAASPRVVVAKPVPAAVVPPVVAAPPLVVRPATAAPTIKDLPPMRAQAPTEPEAEEISFEDEEAPARSSEPGDAPEITPEDLVSIESVPVTPSSRQGRPAPPTTPLAAAPPATAVPAVRAHTPPPPQKIATGPGSATAARSSRVMVPSGGAGALAPPPMSDTHPTNRRRARPWWEELFNDDFIRTMAKVTDEQIARESDFIEDSLAVAKGAMVLDLACGTGRHAIELTRRGYKVVGFDLSLPMLARAADEAQERNQKLNFVQGDMREMTFEDTFDGIYCWNTSFGFFEEEKNAQVVARVHKALRKSGQFLLDVINRDFLIRQAPSLAWFEGEGCICMDEMSIDWITSRMRVKRTMMMDDGRTKEIEYSVRVYSLHELGKVLHDAGFRVAEVSGRATTPGVFFGNESPRTLILAEKR